MRILKLLALTALTVSPSFADDADVAKAIIDKAVKAVGGADVVKKHGNTKFEEVGTFFGQGQEIAYRGKYAIALPNRIRMEIVGVFTVIVDGDKGWMRLPNGVQPLTEKQIQEQKGMQHVAYVTSFLPFAKGDKGYELELAGDSKVGEEDCVGVTCKKSGQRDIKMEFSKKSGYLLRATYTVTAPETGEEVQEEALYEAWKTAEGVTYPEKMRINRDGKKYIESKTTKIEHPASIDATLFAAPKE